MPWKNVCSLYSFCGFCYHKSNHADAISQIITSSLSTQWIIKWQILEYNPPLLILIGLAWKPPSSDGGLLYKDVIIIIIIIIIITTTIIIIIIIIIIMGFQWEKLY